MNTATDLGNPGCAATAQAGETGPVVGVTSTRIYCRPVCRPGRAPKRENCVPFLDAGAARVAGYRACKQCRPDDTFPPTRSQTPAASPLAVRFGVGLTPVGFVFVASTERGVCALDLLSDDDPSPALERHRRRLPGATFQADASASDPVVFRVGAHLSDGRSYDGVSLDLRGTPFRLRVWEALRSIPRGETTTYGGLARTLGLPPGAARAVGSACGANPVSLIVPCHRVVGAGGGLGGYYWGLERKRALLEMESSTV